VIAQHVLVFTLVIAFPIWDYFITRRMRDATSVEYRTQVYVQTLAWQWISSAVAVAVLGLPALFAIHIEPRPAWLPPADAFSGLAIGFLFVVVATVIVLRKGGPEGKLARAFATLDFILPKTPRQRRLWILLALTAGICEELLFRGFLFRYLHEIVPALPPMCILLVAAAVFGINHLYQGFIGALGTAFLAILFGVMFVGTGNLALPMALHALLDLRVLAIPTRTRDA